MTKGRQPPAPHDKLAQVEVTSGYGGNTRLPYVELRLPDRPPLQLEVEEARLIAGMILEAAEGAEQDAFIVEWGMEHIGLELEAAASLLREYRQWREQRRAKNRTTSA